MKNLLPKVYPSNVNTLNSVQIDEFLNSKLRGHALDIREAYAHAGMGSSFNEKHSKGIAKARGLKLGIVSGLSESRRRY